MPRLQYRWWLTLQCVRLLASVANSATLPVCNKHHLGTQTDICVCVQWLLFVQLSTQNTRDNLQPSSETAVAAGTHLPESFRGLLAARHNHLQGFGEVFTQRRRRDVGRQVANVQQAKDCWAWNKSTPTFNNTEQSGCHSMQTSVFPRAVGTGAACSLVTTSRPTPRAHCSAKYIQHSGSSIFKSVF